MRLLSDVVVVVVVVDVVVVVVSSLLFASVTVVVVVTFVFDSVWGDHRTDQRGDMGLITHIVIGVDRLVRQLFAVAVDRRRVVVVNNRE